MESSDDIKSKFGQLRAFGSVGWAFGVLIVGFVISLTEHIKLYIPKFDVSPPILSIP